MSLRFPANPTPPKHWSGGLRHDNSGEVPATRLRANKCNPIQLQGRVARAKSPSIAMGGDLEGGLNALAAHVPVFPRLGR